MSDLAPDRNTLQTMEKKSTETFMEYAQRWRDVASQIDPPLTEKEINQTFVETLKGAYYEKLLASVPKLFADLVSAGEMVEKAIRSGKIDSGELTKKGHNANGKDGDVHAVQQFHQPYRPRYQRSNHYQNPSTNFVASITAPNTSTANQMLRSQFDQIPYSYTSLLP